MGFSADTFKEALKRCHGDVEKAIDILVSNEGVLSPVLQSSKGKSSEVYPQSTARLKTGVTHKGSPEARTGSAVLHITSIKIELFYDC